MFNDSTIVSVTKTIRLKDNMTARVVFSQGYCNTGYDQSQVLHIIDNIFLYNINNINFLGFNFESLSGKVFSFAALQFHAFLPYPQVADMEDRHGIKGF